MSDQAQAGPSGLIRTAADINTKMREWREKFHVLSPFTQMGGAFGPGIVVTVSSVTLDPRVNEYGQGIDTYFSKGFMRAPDGIHAPTAQRAPNKVGLLRIAQCAGIRWRPEQCIRTDNGKEPLYWSFSVAGEYLTPDGIWLPITGTSEVDLREGSAQSKAMTEKQVAMQRQFGLALAECVPLASEILTRRGWRRYDDLQLGEDVLAYDITRDSCVWTPLRAVTVYPEAPVVSFGHSRLSFRCTPDHSWVAQMAPYKDKSRTRPARGPNAARGPERRLVRAVEVSTAQRIVLAAPAEGGDSLVTPAEAAVLGWVMCDGSIKYRGTHLDRVGISQSKPVQVAAIENLLMASGFAYYKTMGEPTVRTFPNGRVSSCLPQTWFYLKAHDSRALFAKAGITGAEDMPALVLRLSQPARAAMLAAMMAADGTARGVFGKKRKPGVMDAWQLLATLEGHALGVPGVSSLGEVPIQGIKRSRHMHGSKITMGDQAIEAVWCPTTDLGTWVMRQDGKVTITGNSKAKNRAIRSLGLQSSYTVQDLLAKPFLIMRATFQPEKDDEVGRRVFAQVAMGMSHLLYPHAPLDQSLAILPAAASPVDATVAPAADVIDIAATPVETKTEPAKPAAPPALRIVQCETKTRKRHVRGQIIDERQFIVADSTGVYHIAPTEAIYQAAQRLMEAKTPIDLVTTTDAQGTSVIDEITPETSADAY